VQLCFVVFAVYQLNNHYNYPKQGCSSLKMLFLAVVMDFVLLAYVKIYSVAGIIQSSRVQFPPRPSKIFTMNNRVFLQSVYARFDETIQEKTVLVYPSLFRSLASGSDF
jgi:hypothetical protein